ncbi:MAG: ATP-binding protein, partial [Candidatus Saccharimonadales bacterium]
MANSDKYTMTISRLTVDKLGVKLYDRVSAVIAELIANSYDADATEVDVRAPMSELLATKQAGKLADKGYVIEVVDNGIGMNPDQVNDFYLKVGAERRTDPKRGEKSKKYDRKVMGRKGVGKLAPFGVCQKIEVLTAGGKEVSGNNKDGKSVKGHLTAHLILDRAGILQPTDEDYHPAVAALDGTVSEKHGTTLRLMIFDHRTVPSHEDFERQLAQRFGLSTANWQIKLTDTSPNRDMDKPVTRVVWEFK